MEKSDIKQVICIRRDLNMRKGKMVAQGSHASMAFITKRASFDDNYMFSALQNQDEAEKWMKEGFTKICVSVDSEQELMEKYNQAMSAGLTVELIIDSGFTEFSGVPTKTCIAIGPNLSSEIDEITGNLKLL